MSPPEECIEDKPLFFWRNSDPGISDNEMKDGRVITFLSPLYFHKNFSLLCKLHSITHQITKDLSQPNGSAVESEILASSSVSVQALAGAGLLSPLVICLVLLSRHVVCWLGSCGVVFELPKEGRLRNTEGTCGGELMRQGSVRPLLGV
jgi:hypothetical protein